MKHKKSLDWFGFMAMCLAFSALCISLVRSSTYSWDFAGISMTAMGVLTAILIAWQLKSVIDYNSEKKEVLNEIKNIKNDFESVKSDSLAQIRDLEKRNIKSTRTLNIFLSELYLGREYYLSLLLFLKSLEDWSDELTIHELVLDKLLIAIQSTELVLDEDAKKSVLKAAKKIRPEVYIELDGLRKLISLAKE